MAAKGEHINPMIGYTLKGGDVLKWAMAQSWKPHQTAEAYWLMRS